MEFECVQIRETTSPEAQTGLISIKYEKNSYLFLIVKEVCSIIQSRYDERKRI